ncbi:hypothetical protein L228DRAFT_258330 [Xylona heveae TC161]|uniref:Uncharacterized protein n=1 Tax=Xylona heveae (strain CBS 132557 / TC161) TaxID=1328760 RepID=A0A165K4U4_XYLHT|nr:hypothetical protein L228DRAFT_258330 [Xylona heveae TC161]KZF26982.1 hypothetical protein L228DRAFT_258330 [Xylona heveae TC161]
MTPAPPAYTAGASPPSYDEVVKKLETLVGDDVTPDSVLNAAAQLSDEETNILIDGADDHWPLETDKQKEDFAIGSGQTLSSPEGKAQLESAGNETTQATVEIENIFAQLHLKIAQIDRIHHSEFEPGIIRLLLSYRGILTESRDLAAKISVQATNFDGLIVKFCADDTIPVESRRGLIESYIATNSSFESNAHGIINRFHGLTNDFGSFVAEFSNWAKDREGEITEQIKTIEQELQDLHKKLYRLESALLAFEILFKASIPIAGSLAKLLPKFAPFIILGGVITAVASYATIAGLAAGISRTNFRIHTKTREKEELQAELENIRQTRAELEDFGSNSLTQFQTAISILTGTWEQIIEDAKVIQSWIARGADSKHRPEYMDLNLRHAVHKLMNLDDAISGYLESYAKGTNT